MTSKEFVEKWKDKVAFETDDADYLYWLASYYTDSSYIREMTHNFLSTQPVAGCSFHRAMSLDCSWR